MEFFYGCCGGFIGIIVSHPFDTIKTRIQSDKVKTIKDAIKMKKLYLFLFHGKYPLSHVHNGGSTTPPATNTKALHQIVPRKLLIGYTLSFVPLCILEKR